MFLEKNYLASAVGLRTISMTFDINTATNVETDEVTGNQYIPAGSYYVSASGSDSGSGSSTGSVERKGIVLDNIYFKRNETTAIGALVVAGHILKDKLPYELDDSTIYDLASQGLFFELSAPTVVPANEAEANPED